MLLQTSQQGQQSHYEQNSVAAKHDDKTKAVTSHLHFRVWQRCQRRYLDSPLGLAWDRASLSTNVLFHNHTECWTILTQLRLRAVRALLHCILDQLQSYLALPKPKGAIIVSAVVCRVC